MGSLSVASNYDATETEARRHQKPNVWSDPESVTRERRPETTRGMGDIRTL